MEMVWGAAGDATLEGGRFIANRLDELGPVGSFFKNALGFVPGVAITRQIVSADARAEIKKCSNINVNGWANFWNRVDCGGRAFFSLDPREKLPYT